MMKKKILILMTCLFAFAIALSFNSNSSNDEAEFPGLFIESDNIAYADTDGCTSDYWEVCWVNMIPTPHYRAVK